MHYFDPPINAGVFLGPAEIRVRDSRKRKRRDASYKDNDSDDDDGNDNLPSASAERVSEGVLKSKVTKDKSTTDNLRVNYKTDDGSSAPAKYAPQRNLRHQHLNVLHTILHRCLQEHDYDRASRAFGALLRFEIDGRRVNLRKNGIWGIGVEILLRRSYQTASSGLGSQPDLTNPTAQDRPRQSCFQHVPGEEGFNAARKYLDRLILHLPYQSHRPDLLSELQLHPVLITMRIFHALAESRRIVQDPRSEDEDGMSDSSFSDSSLNRKHTSAASSPISRVKAAKTQELDRARQISETLESLTASPPYDKLEQFWSLRGNVSLWMRDLVAELARIDGLDEDTIEVESHREAARTALSKAASIRKGRDGEPPSSSSDETFAAGDISSSEMSD